jgi:hypothetical protein
MDHGQYEKVSCLCLRMSMTYTRVAGEGGGGRQGRGQAGEDVERWGVGEVESREVERWAGRAIPLTSTIDCYFLFLLFPYIARLDCVMSLLIYAVPGVGGSCDC